MGELRERYLEVQVGTTRVVGGAKPGLRVTGRASKSLNAKEPNSCEIQFYNLSPENRQNLSRTDRPVASVTLGYKNDRTQVFYGQMLHCAHERKGGDIITTVSTTDGGDKAQKARVKLSFGPRTKTGDVLRALVKALGLKVGNVETVARQLNAGERANLYVNGVSLQGYAAPQLSALCRSAGLEWSIQDGAVQLVPLGQASAKFAPLLSEDLLLRTPSISPKGIVTSRTLIQTDFLPGRQVQISSEFVSGQFRLEKCEYEWDTHADVWDVEFEAKDPRKKKA
jgi:hypothetical protein